jgi:hypothetical protein
MLDNLAGGFQAVEYWHGQVHQNHIRRNLAREQNGITAMLGFAYDFHVGLRRKHGTQAFSNDGVVLG